MDFLTQPWPWYIAGPIIGLTVPLVYLYAGRKWGVSSTFRDVCAAVVPSNFDYFRYSWRTQGAWRLTMALGLVAGGFLAYNMFFALTPPRHADHDHAIAKLDAGGFLWIEATDGNRRNLVGIPEKVLVLHFFDPTSVDLSEQKAAAKSAATVSDDPLMKVYKQVDHRK